MGTGRGGRCRIIELGRQTAETQGVGLDEWLVQFVKLCLAAGRVMCALITAATTIRRGDPYILNVAS
jgi:hypothetical protein